MQNEYAIRREQNIRMKWQKSRGGRRKPCLKSGRRRRVVKINAMNKIYKMMWIINASE